MSHLQIAADGAKCAWNPPSFNVDPAYLPIPGEWTPDHVARRLVEAFRTDHRMPRIERPKAPNSVHFAVTSEIVLDQDGGIDSEALAIAIEARLDDQRGLHPAPQEVAVMETCFGWLALVRESDLDACLALRAWAVRMAGAPSLKRASGNSIRAIARKLGTTHVSLLKRKDRALSLVCSRLNADRVAVF